MQTECITDQFEFEGFERRRVIAAFDGGRMTSDAGALLLRQADRKIGLIERVAACFDDGRAQTVAHDPELYKERHLVECFINKIKHFRRIATRYDKTAQAFMSMICIACMMVWLR